MKQKLLKDEITEFIKEKKVKAAVFLSYNFDVDFFENYLLPLLVPFDFTDNKIQNALLWRTYATHLPPVTVICDYHAKGPNAPNLGYDIFVLGTSKQCFHCKNSFILTEDDRLMVITGSNNLTYAGWCHNVEIFSVEIFENNIHYPKRLKDEFKKLLESIKHESEGLSIVTGFFNKQLYTADEQKYFWDSGRKPFADFLELEGLLSDDQIEKIEIISPYIFSGEVDGLKFLSSLSKRISVAIPYSGTDVLGIKKDVFINIRENGFEWKKLIVDEEAKNFRFNHSKVYRLKGQQKMYTIVGSVNLTKAAWNGLNHQGNYESAIAYVENTSGWNDWLIDCKIDSLDNLIFDEKVGEEFLSMNRKTAPQISFTLNWQTKNLSYVRMNKEDVYWWLSDNQSTGSKNKKNLAVDKSSFSLSNDEIERLSTNPIITVSWNNKIFTFYPKQEGIELKPLPAKYRLSDQQIFELWNELAEKPGKNLNESNIPEKLSEHFDSGDDYIGPVQQSNSLNLMATHLSGLITLEKALFNEIKRSSFEKINYYLFTENVDTLPGYMKLIKKLKDEEKGISTGFYWLLMNIILNQFYTKASANSKIKNKVQQKLDEDMFGSRIIEIEKEIRQVEKSILQSEPKMKSILKWVTKQIQA